ncbi:MAG: hypothetical protein KC912_11900 [Proteobacteria bacterium]|nr:hypothetical protein [Pseudomonadota bacterium]
MRPWLPAIVPFLLFSLACGGMFYDQSQYEGDRTTDVYGAPLPQVFKDLNLPPPGVNVGMLSGDTSMTTYHQMSTNAEMFELYGDHLRSEGWVEDSNVAVYAYGRRFSKGDVELQLDASQSYSGGYGGYGGGYGMPSPSQMTVTRYNRVLVAPWDTLAFDFKGGKIRSSSTMVEVTWDGFGGPSGGEMLNDILRAFVLSGWDVETVAPSDTYGSASVTRGSSRVDITIGSPGPGGITMWYSGY